MQLGVVVHSVAHLQARLLLGVDLGNLHVRKQLLRCALQLGVQRTAFRAPRHVVLHQHRVSPVDHARPALGREVEHAHAAVRIPSDGERGAEARAEREEAPRSLCHICRSAVLARCTLWWMGGVYPGGPQAARECGPGGALLHP